MATPVKILFLLPAVLVLAATAPARSHAIQSSLERLSSLTDQLVLDTRFGNGEPADDAVVRLVPPDGNAIEIGRTDAKGQLRFRLPHNATAAWEVQVDRGPGHRDYLELPGATPATPRPAIPLSSLQANGPAGLLGLTVIGGALGGSLAWRRSRRRHRD